MFENHSLLLEDQLELLNSFDAPVHWSTEVMYFSSLGDTQEFAK